ncbi:MAG: response regulator transcription factor [Bacteroidota bacterium]
MAEQKIRIALVDDQKLFRGGLKLILAKRPIFEVVFEAKDGRQFLEKFSFEPVDIVLLDVEMPEMDGMETLKVIREKYPKLKVIMLTMHDSERLIGHLMQMGANGFLLKDEEPEVVCKAVERVHEEGLFFRDYVSKALLKGATKGKASAGTTASAYLRPQLSDRELEVLKLICQEYTSQEIAEKLFLSVRTVDGHRRRIQDKIGARNTAGLVMYAVNNNLV